MKKIATLFVFVVFFAIFLIAPSRASEKTTKTEIVKKEMVSKAEPETTLVFVGDIMLSRGIDGIMKKRNDYDFPYALLGGFLSDADLTFANLESPVSTRGKKWGSIYSFRTDPHALVGLKNAGVDVVSIANNHIWDYGREAFDDTLQHLTDAGISYVGGGPDFASAHQGVLKEVNGVKIAFLAYTDLLPKSVSAGANYPGVSYLDPEQMIMDIQGAKNHADIVITSFHWGTEYMTKHNFYQENIAQKAIDAGASLVIGHHPHVVQEVEAYKDGYIAYSLGNFVFDQNFSPETSVGLALKVRLLGPKIEKIEQIQVKFSPLFQPYIEETAQ